MIYRGTREDWVKAGSPLPAIIDNKEYVYDCDKREQWPVNNQEHKILKPIYDDYGKILADILNKETEMKMVEPIAGLRLYFDERDQGSFYTANAGYCSPRSDKHKMMIKQESKMTRQEAIDKIIATGKISEHWANGMVISLEALGLIKFSEEEKIGKSPAAIIADQLTKVCNAYRQSIPECAVAAEIIHELKLYGYKIVKEQS